MNVLAITYWSFKDALVQSAVIPYLRMIREASGGGNIFLVTLEQARFRMSAEESRAVKEKLKSEGINLIDFGYSPFGLKALAKWLVFLPKLIWIAYKERVDVVHAWCTPAGGAGYVVSRVKGIPLIIDSYEPHAESMVELGTWPRNGIAHRLLFLLEKLQSRYAHAVIATTESVRTYAREKYGAVFDRYYVKPASVDLNLFSTSNGSDRLSREEFGFTDKVVCVYAGKIGGIYLEREIFDFFKVASAYWGDQFRVLLLTDAPAEKIRELALAAGVDPGIVKSKFVGFKEVPRHMALADFAINPVRPIPSKRYCTSVKDGEYWAMGLPVVIPRDIGDDSQLVADNGIGAVLKDFSSESYLNAVKNIDALLKSGPREQLSERIRSVAEQHRNLARTRRIYEELYGPK